MKEEGGDDEASFHFLLLGFSTSIRCFYQLTRDKACNRKLFLGEHWEFDFKEEEGEKFHYFLTF